jgi:hypothetical protein
MNGEATISTREVAVLERLLINLNKKPPTQVCRAANAG